MVQIIPPKQLGGFGQLAKGFAEGANTSLSQNLPKYIEHGMLTQGLKKFQNESQGKSPMDQFAQLSSIYGISPQMLQTFGELAKLQNKRDAFARAGGSEPAQLERTPRGEPVDFLGGRLNQQRQPVAPQEENQSRGIKQIRSGSPQIVPENPLNEQFTPRNPWSPQERNQRINEYISNGFLPDQAQQLASDDERRELTVPEVEQKRLERLEEIKNKAEKALEKKLGRKLQKTDKGVYADITGEMLNNINREMERDLRSNPERSIEDVAEDWSEKALNVAKAKTQFNKLAETTGLSNVFSRNSSLSKLKEYSDIFKDAGNSEEYKNMLISKLGLSPQGAASVAFPISKPINKYLNDFEKKGFSKRKENASKAAIDIEKFIQDEDSILSIMRNFRDRFPGFDQQEFLRQLSEDKDRIGLNARQRLEIAEGIQEMRPTWGDFLILGR